MDLNIRWHAPFVLVPGDDAGLIYTIPNLMDVPDGPGVYVFARVHGSKVSPLYIGKASQLRRRIDRQLNNVRLMVGVKNAQAGTRACYVGEFVARPNQDSGRAIAVVEQALITAAILSGFDILNVQGKRIAGDSIVNSGNTGARSWLPENTLFYRRAR